MRTRLALSLYRLLLVFCPKGFRTEFGAEMVAVFTQALAVRRESMARLLWRELRDWPGVVWHIHLARRRKSMAQTGSLPVRDVPPEQPATIGARQEAWLAALAFLFYLWYTATGTVFSILSEPLHLTDQAHGILGGGIGLVILLVDFIVFLRCWKRGCPRWSLPYLGIVLTFLMFSAQAFIRNDGSLLIYVPLLVFVVIFMLTALGWWWKGLHSLYERLSSDWTLLGLVYFSCVPFTFSTIMDETRYEYGVELVLSVIAALGVLAYMRSASLWQRVAVLPVVFTVANLVAMFYFLANLHGWESSTMSSDILMLTTRGLVGIMPLLVFGFLELGRHAVHRWLQAA